MKVEDFCLSNHARKPICLNRKKKKKTRVKNVYQIGEKENTRKNTDRRILW